MAPEGQAGLSHHTSSERATRCAFPRGTRPSPTGHRTGRSSKHHLGSAGASHKTLSPQTGKRRADAARESEREDGAGTGRGLLVRGQMSTPSTVSGRHSANTEGTNRQMTKNRLGKSKGPGSGKKSPVIRPSSHIIHRRGEEAAQSKAERPVAGVDVHTLHVYVGGR